MSEKSSRSQSASRRSNKILSPTSSQEQITDKDSSTAQPLDKVKNERAVNATKQDEDRRRRTIIIEKKNGTFGFTLQSYGIHYKKEQEIEMITYVDYVEYDGPAYKAGMREGDVILSINGQDMEKADHKALVNFIKNCDSRMRMVVLFEDCVRKVELHLRYIQLQRILQSKTAELDLLCMKEREVLQGKWKSQSLPARKKGNPRTQEDAIDLQQEEPHCRSTISTEDVARVPSQSRIMLAYPCVDSRYSCVVRSEDSNECLIGWNRDSRKTRPVIVKTGGGEQRETRYVAKDYQQTIDAMSKDAIKSRENPNKSKHFHHHTRHLCNPCIQALNNQDNMSLEAYDLASPCCDPDCVPSARRKSKQQKHRRENQSKFHDREEFKDRSKCGSSQKLGKERDCGEDVLKTNSHRSQKYLSNLVSQFSLHSCTSSDGGQNSGISYTTSLSSDTLYWDGNENKTQAKHLSCRVPNCKSQQPCENYQTFQPVKPKSWDNLTTKAFGGYGFGYGYVDAGISNKNHFYVSASTCLNSNSSNTVPCKAKGQTKTNAVVNLKQVNFKSEPCNGGRMHGNQIYNKGHHRLGKPAKSNENLLLLKKSNPSLTNSSLSCECLENCLPFADNNVRQVLTIQTGDFVHCHRNGFNESDCPKPRRGSVKQTGNVSRL